MQPATFISSTIAKIEEISSRLSISRIWAHLLQLAPELGSLKTDACIGTRPSCLRFIFRLTFQRSSTQGIGPGHK